MTRSKFDSNRVLGEGICALSRKEMCELVARLCAVVRAEAGPGGVRGGIYPNNISVDEDGSPALGPVCVGQWSDEELRFAAPEIYWDGKTSPASDVYSIGLLLYFGVNKGVLPFERESGDARQRRFDGESFTVPAAAGERLGDIIRRATRFKASERYQSMEELGVLLESCVKNLYIDGEPSGETIFQKNDEELDPIERMMLGIISKADQPEEIPESDDTSETAEAETPESRGAVDEAAPAEAEEAAPTEEKQETEKPKAETEKPKAETEKPKAETEKPKAETEKPKAETEKAPVQPRRFTREKKPVVILTEEKNPELAPVVPAKARSAASYGGAMDREKKISEKMKQRRRRSVAIILVMCAALVIIAIVFNALLRDLNGIPTPDNATGGDVNLHTASPDYYVNPADPNPTGDDAAQQGGAIMSNSTDGSAAPLEQTTPTAAPQTSPDAAAPQATTQPQQGGDAAKPRYEIFVEDVSWTEAQARCSAKGGHLAVVSNQAELEEIIALADEKGVEMLWLGCHRVDGELVWENGESVDYYPWSTGEPSLMDAGDNVAEDYLLLWYHNAWAYNDSRNDPVADYPQWYSGNIAYVCEY